jgi:hypothetical protein
MSLIMSSICLQPAKSDHTSSSYRINSIMLVPFHSLNFSIARKSVLNVDKLTLSIMYAVNPVIVRPSPSSVSTAAHSGLRGNIVQCHNS